MKNIDRVARRVTGSAAHAYLFRRGLKALVCLATLCTSCGLVPKKEKLTPPPAVVAPYDASGGEVLFAVVPLRNESGTTEADPTITADKLVAALEEVRGVRALPLNRTLEAMRALEITEINRPSDARRIAEAVGADALIAGSVTAYDPYTPALGLALVMYARTAPVLGGAVPVTPAPDMRSLRNMTSEPVPSASVLPGGDRPTNAISENFDAKNHQVLTDVQQYARGRVTAPSALDWRRFIRSMDLYQEFCAHEVVERLMESERIRLGIPADPATDSGPKAR